jgi:transcriptional regulator with XRE-family HTH domain
VAKRAGIGSRSTLKNYEDGRQPSLRVLWRLCQVLDADIEALVTAMLVDATAGEFHPSRAAATVTRVESPRAAALLDAFEQWDDERQLAFLTVADVRPQQHAVQTGPDRTPDAPQVEARAIGARGRKRSRTS